MHHIMLFKLKKKSLVVELSSLHSCSNEEKCIIDCNVYITVKQCLRGNQILSRSINFKNKHIAYKCKKFALNIRCAKCLIALPCNF